MNDFRRGERGRLHNPEFAILEWYRPDWDHHALMDEVEDLVRAVLSGEGVPLDLAAEAAGSFERWDPSTVPDELSAGGIGEVLRASTPSQRFVRWSGPQSRSGDG